MQPLTCNLAIKILKSMKIRHFRVFQFQFNVLFRRIFITLRNFLLARYLYKMCLMSCPLSSSSSSSKAIHYNKKYVHKNFSDFFFYKEEVLYFPSYNLHTSTERKSKFSFAFRELLFMEVLIF